MGRFRFTCHVTAFLILTIMACNDGDTTTAGNTSVVINPPTNANSVVCDPFNTSNPALVGHGIASSLYYLTPDMPRYDNTLDYINYGVLAPVTLFLNEINVPTRPFNQGFTTQAGSTLLDNDGNTLYEYFALQMEGGLTLGPNDSPGNYQFAILSDDGALLNVNDTGTGYRVLVNDDGTHPTEMGCTTSPVNFTSSTVVPFIYDYHQGPRFHIASVLLWRPMPTDPSLVNDPLCGQMGNGLFFDSTQTPSAPQPAYTALLSRGWKPLVQENFMLPSTMGGHNPCAPNVPLQLSNFQISQLTETSATLTWNTNNLSNSVVSIAPYPSTNFTSTTDNTMTTTHSEVVTGLTNFTVYNVFITSTDASGNSSSTTVTTFRTLF